jgi:hypothetical protein
VHQVGVEIGEKRTTLPVDTPRQLEFRIHGYGYARELAMDLDMGGGLVGYPGGNDGEVVPTTHCVFHEPAQGLGDPVHVGGIGVREESDAHVRPPRALGETTPEPV